MSKKPSTPKLESSAITKYPAPEKTLRGTAYHDAMISELVAQFAEFLTSDLAKQFNIDENRRPSNNDEGEQTIRIFSEWLVSNDDNLYARATKECDEQIEDYDPFETALFLYYEGDDAELMAQEKEANGGKK